MNKIKNIFSEAATSLTERKGILLAGGKGTRLAPLTTVLSKQLMPVYDKPMFFYPLSVLMLSGIKDFLIVTNPGQRKKYYELLSPLKDIGIKIEFAEQKKPGGIPEALIIGEKFIGKKSVALILGDNFFYGSMLTPLIKKSFLRIICSCSTICFAKVSPM